MDQHTVQWICLPGGKLSANSVLLRLLAMYRPHPKGDDSSWNDWPRTLSHRADRFCVEVTSDPDHVPSSIFNSDQTIGDAATKSRYWHAIIGVSSQPLKPRTMRVMQSSRSTDACEMMQHLQRNAFRNLLPSHLQSKLHSYNLNPQPLYSQSKDDRQRRMQAIDQLRDKHAQWLEAQYYLNKLSDRPLDTLHSSILRGFQALDARSQEDRANLLSDPRHAVLLFHGRAWVDRASASLNETMARSDGQPDDAKPFVERPVAEKLAVLRNYPALMQTLGLLFELTFDIPESAVRNRLIRAFPASGGKKVEFGSSPWTQVDAEGFYPQSVNDEVANGFLSISNSQYVLAGFEVDAAALRDVHREKYVDDMLAARQQLGEAQKQTSLPISGGVSLLRRKRVAALHARHARFTNQKMQVFTAETLLGSLEPQVWAKKYKQEFLSLSERVESYHISDVLPDVSDHTVRVGVRSVARKDPDASLYPEAATGTPYQVHDALFRWDGWHLAKENPLNPDKPKKPPHPLPFTVTTVLPKRIPGLRFGYSYQLRVRALDLAGYPMGDSDDTMQVREFMYCRTDPIDPPAVLLSESLPADRYPGEMLDTMVVRTTSNPPFQTDFCARVIAPPRVGLLFAERHGVFDEKSPLNTSSYAQVELQQSEFVADPESRLPIAAVDDDYQSPRACTYLPDPMAKFICAELRWNGQSIGLNGEQKVQICDNDQWPAADLVKVVLSKGSTIGGQWRSNQDGHTLHVWLPEGTKAELLLSCTMDEDDFKRHIVATWIEDSGARDAIREVVLAGQHPLVTPPRVITLVHALEVPPDPPLVHVPAIQQRLNSTIVHVEVSAAANMQLVSSTDITAEWTDCSSDRDAPIDGKAKVGTVYDTHLQELWFALPSTSFREVGYVGVCSSRFAEYFHSDKDALKGPASAPNNRVPHLNTARPKTLDLSYVIPLFETISHDKSLRRPKHSYLRQRKGGALRIFFGGRNCTSGPGEKLGVVVFDTAGPTGYPLSRESKQWSNEKLCKATGSSASDYQAKTVLYNSIWAGDNLWPSKVSTGGPGLADFLNPDSVVKGATLLELEGPDPSGEPKYPITLVTYKPQFDPDRQLSWCDVALSVPSSFAFVRLAVVRYQPNSIRFADCSTVVYADYISLAPTRSLIVMRSPGRLHLKCTIYVFLLGDQDERQDAFSNMYSVTLDRSEGLGRSGIWWRPLTKNEARIEPLATSAYNEFTAPNNSTKPILAAFSVQLLKRGGDLRLCVWESEIYSADRQTRCVYADSLSIPDDEL